MKQKKYYLFSTLAATLMLATVGTSAFAEELSGITILNKFLQTGAGNYRYYPSSEFQTPYGSLPKQGFDPNFYDDYVKDIYKDGVFWTIDVGSNNGFNFGTTGATGTLNPYAYATDITGRTATSSGGNPLTLGAAYLYKLFATGAEGFDGDFRNPWAGIPNGVLDLRDLSYAIRSAMQVVNLVTQDTSSAYYYVNLDWEKNYYTSLLLAENSDKNYWLQEYNFLERYDEIGDYCVFVMNMRDPNAPSHIIPNPYCYDTVNPGTIDIYHSDFLFLAEGTNFRNGGNGGSGVPEPATLLLWTLGSFGLAGGSWVRKHRMNIRMKKLACGHL